MHNRASFPKTPDWARHIMRLNRVAKLQISPEIVELAKTSTVDHSIIPSHLRFSKPELAAIQYVLDWKGRCMVVDRFDPNSEMGAIISLLSAKMLGSKSVLVGVKANEGITLWKNLISKFCLDCTLVEVESNGRTKTITQGKGEEMTWVISPWLGLRNPMLVSDYNTDHFICSVYEGMFPYDTHDILTGLAGEIFRTTIIAYCQDFWTESADLKNSYKIANIAGTVSSVLRTNSHMVNVSGNLTRVEQLSMYFRSRGVKLDNIGILAACGVCTDIVVDPSSPHFKHIYNNALIDGYAIQGKRRIEILQSMEKIEQTVAKDYGKPVPLIVDDALAGNADAKKALDILRTQAWAKMKASTFYSYLQTRNSKAEKVIIVSENDQINKYMNTSLGAVVLSDDPDERLSQQANFCHPNPVSQQFNLPSSHRYRAIGRLLTKNILDLDLKVLETVDTVVFTEYPYDPALIEDYIELSQIYRFKLVFGTLRGTFDEYLSEKLLDKYF